MKKTLLLFAFLFLNFMALQSQPLSILFVDDTPDAFGNAELFASSLDSLGYAYDYFNAGDSLRSPDFEEMETYDLVIWHTSSWGDQLAFWNTFDETNPHLEFYLMNGGNLWVVGSDFLFDRYGAAPDTFQTGDFVHDYLGVAQYESQAYGDDGNIGVPAVEPVAGQPIAGLETIDWTFQTLWWADAVVPVQDAQTVYEMAGDYNGQPYIFSGKPTGIWYDRSPGYSLSFFFDLALASSFDKIKNTTAAVLAQFSSLISAAPERFLGDRYELSVFPNPAGRAFNLKLELESSDVLSASLLNVMGQRVETVFPASQWGAGEHIIHVELKNELPDGMYFLNVTRKRGTEVRRVVLRQ